jgi:hypothetical protein
MPKSKPAIAKLMCSLRLEILKIELTPFENLARISSGEPGL